MFIGNILYIYIIYDIIYEIIYKKAYNSSFHQNLEKIQYISPLAITGAIRGTSKENLCQGLESLEKKRLYRKLCYLNKIFKKQYPTYLLNGIPVASRSYFTRNVESVHSFKVKQHSFFPSTRLAKNIRKLESLNIFKKIILKSIRSSQKFITAITAIKLLTRLRVGLKIARKLPKLLLQL